MIKRYDIIDNIYDVYKINLTKDLYKYIIKIFKKEKEKENENDIVKF